MSLTSDSSGSGASPVPVPGSGPAEPAGRSGLVLSAERRAIARKADKERARIDEIRTAHSRLSNGEEDSQGMVVRVPHITELSTDNKQAMADADAVFYGVMSPVASHVSTDDANMIPESQDRRGEDLVFVPEGEHMNLVLVAARRYSMMRRELAKANEREGDSSQMQHLLQEEGRLKDEYATYVFKHPDDQMQRRMWRNAIWLGVLFTIPFGVAVFGVLWMRRHWHKAQADKLDASVKDMRGQVERERADIAAKAGSMSTEELESKTVESARELVKVLVANRELMQDPDAPFTPDDTNVFPALPGHTVRGTVDSHVAQRTATVDIQYLEAFGAVAMQVLQDPSLNLAELRDGDGRPVQRNISLRENPVAMERAAGDLAIALGHDPIGTRSRLEAAGYSKGQELQNELSADRSAPRDRRTDRAGTDEGPSAADPGPSRVIGRGLEDRSSGPRRSGARAV